MCRLSPARDYDNTTNPDHETAIPDNVQRLPREDAWVPANFDHNQFYPLNGAHAVVANECALLCHIGGNYNNTPTDCAGCQSDHDNTTNPAS
ncbi:MAG: hypothetical protein R2795_22155 [Saprospiraceae bacterium]